jgi:hypothetical protein
MRSQRTDSLLANLQWLYELKLDGHRAIALKRDGVVHLRSRNDNDDTRQHLRHSNFIGLREDKKTSDVVREDHP